MVDAGILVLLGIIGAGMAGLNLWILFQFFPRNALTPTWSRAILVSYLLIASVALWVSVDFDLLAGNTSVGWTAVMFGLQFMMMSPFVWVVPLIFKGDTIRVRFSSWRWPVFLTFLVLANELAMGASFVGVTLGVGAIAPSGQWGVLLGASRSILSVWFLWVMFANMVPLLFFARLPSLERWALLTLAASGIVAPLVEVQPWMGLAAVSVVMAGALGFLVLRLFRASGAPVENPRLLTAVVVAFAAMVLSQVAFLLRPASAWAPVPFALVMFGVMASELLFVVRSILTPSHVEPIGLPAELEVNSASPTD